MSALASVVSDETGPYRPSDSEPFMNERQVAYFKTKLLSWKDDILRESKGTVTNLKAETENHPDLVDRASSESDRALELRTRDRQRKLISKIDDALRRIEPGKGGELQLTDAIELLIEEGEPVHVVVHEGKRHDLGNPGGYIPANVDFGLRDEKYGPALYTAVKKIIADFEAEHPGVVAKAQDNA